MPSHAFLQHFQVLLKDADELLVCRHQLPLGLSDRQAKLAALNRAVVGSCVSAWEAYIEELVLEAINALRPIGTGPLGPWSALNAAARSAIGRFHNPNVENVRVLISDAIGLPDITGCWFWSHRPVARVRELLAEALSLRHQIAHGVNPRPAIPASYGTRLPRFFRRLASCTDAGVRAYLVNPLGIANPWPP